MFMPHPAAAMRAMVDHLRPGGIAAFQEPDLTQGPYAYPSSSLLDQIWQWISVAFRESGADPEMGLRLRSLYLGAGLSGPHQNPVGGIALLCLPPQRIHCCIRHRGLARADSRIEGFVSMPTTSPSEPTSRAASNATSPAPLPRSSTFIPCPMPASRNRRSVKGWTNAA
jgi:hypothetical protein